MNKAHVFLFAALSLAIRYTLSFTMAHDRLSSFVPLLVVFTPIIPTVLSVFKAGRDHENAHFLLLFKEGMKNALGVSFLYIIGLFVLFQFVNPFEFEARKELIIEQQMLASEGLEGFDAQAVSERIEGIFTAFNYVTFTLLGFLLLSVFYSVLASFFGLYFKRKYHAYGD